jgi:hypothetical protein
MLFEIPSDLEMRIWLPTEAMLNSTREVPASLPKSASHHPLRKREERKLMKGLKRAFGSGRVAPRHVPNPFKHF